MAEIVETERSEDVSVMTYSPSPFENAAWVVVDEPKGDVEFAPLTIVSIQSECKLTDPLFADYSSIRSTQSQSVGLMEGLDSSRAATGGFGGDYEGSHMAQEGEVLSCEKQRESGREGQTAGIDPTVHEQEVHAAYEKGVQEGYERARQDGEAQQKCLEERTSAIMEDVRAQVAENVAALERQGVDLAVAIARKLLKASVESSVEYIQPILREAIALAGSASIKRVRVSPRDFEFLKNVRPESVGAAIGDTWTFEADESIQMGCIVVTSAGEVDFDLEKAWERIRNQMSSHAGKSDG